MKSPFKPTLAQIIQQVGVRLKVHHATFPYTQVKHNMKKKRRDVSIKVGYVASRHQAKKPLDVHGENMMVVGIGTNGLRVVQPLKRD